MAAYRCASCRKPFIDAKTEQGLCPFCGRLQPAGSELPPVPVACSCGKSYRVAAMHSGKTMTCLHCKAVLRVPEAPGLAQPKPAAPRRPASRPADLREYAYAAILLTLIPLAGSMIGRADDTAERFKSTLEHNKTVFAAMEEKEHATIDDFMAALPGNRIEGAHLPRSTWTHWLYALLAAGLFFGASIALFSKESAKPLDLVKIGLFTGTIGIIFLLVVQFAAMWSQGLIIYGKSILVIFFYIVKFIGFSYRAALDDDNGFLLSFFGFTFGVGLCEEVCKALPLLFHFRRKATLGWRGALLWGLASGVGFGISEGITYSSDFYNGISTSGIYVVRFISCVGLHAMWSAAIGVTLWRKQMLVQGDMNWYDWFLPILQIIWAPMLLHGLYDTLLKKDHNVMAMLVALASFAWLVFTTEMTRRNAGEEDDPSPAALPA